MTKLSNHLNPEKDIFTVAFGQSLIKDCKLPMNHKLSSTSKFFIAMLTGVRSFSSVRSLMQTKSFLDREAFLANIANIRHFAGMSSHVDRQRSDLNELFAADSALVRLITSVFSTMFFHFVSSSKSLLAIGTIKFFLSCLFRFSVLISLSSIRGRTLFNVLQK